MALYNRTNRPRQFPSRSSEIQGILGVSLGHGEPAL